MIQKSTPYDVIIRRNYDPVNVKCLLLEHTALEKKKSLRLFIMIK